MALEGFTPTIGSEFGEVDNPAYGGYTEAGWNKGAFGDSIAGWDNQGFALPPKVLKSYGYGSKGFASDFNSKYEIQVLNPQTNTVTSGPLKDIGPGASTGAGIDMLAGSRAALGLDKDFKGPVQYRIVAKGSPAPEGTQLASADTGTQQTTGDTSAQPTFQPAAGTGQTDIQNRLQTITNLFGNTAATPTAATPAAGPDPNALLYAGLSGAPGAMGPLLLARAIAQQRAQRSQAINQASQFGGNLVSAIGKMRAQQALAGPNTPILDPFQAGGQFDVTQGGAGAQNVGMYNPLDPFGPGGPYDVTRPT